VKFIIIHMRMVEIWKGSECISWRCFLRLRFRSRLVGTLKGAIIAQHKEKMLPLKIALLFIFYREVIW